MTHTFEHVACTVCGCVCDDLAITVDEGRITATRNACPLAEPWFHRQNEPTPTAATIDGTEATVEDAVQCAAELLRAARSPLIYGLSRSTTEGQRAAIELAERLGATIDTTAATGHAASIRALQQVGESTCTLGEVRNRADLIVYWASDPVTTHPRHLERYTLDPVGEFVPNGRRDRHLVVVDSSRTPTATLADQFVEVSADRHWHALRTLHGLIRGIDPLPGSDLGLPIEPLRELAERMLACRWGIIFFGVELTRGPTGHRTIEALLSLVTELHQRTRFYARRMRRSGDVAGADSVLTWQTGYPFAVNFAAGYPRYGPEEFTAPRMLERGEVDVCLFVGSETGAEFSQAAREHLKRIPVIALESPGVESVVEPDVRFTTAVYGVHRPGTAYRMDEVPIPLRVLLPTSLPSDADVLRALLQAVVT